MPDPEARTPARWFRCGRVWRAPQERLAFALAICGCGPRVVQGDGTGHSTGSAQTSAQVTEPTEPTEPTLATSGGADSSSSGGDDGGAVGWSIWGEVHASQRSIGSTIAVIPDLDGDGFDEVVIGAPTVDGVAVGSGRVYVVRGKPNNDDIQLDDIALGVGGWVIEGEGPNAQLGQCVADAGDVNGDGIGDIVIGAPGMDDGLGRAYVVYGGRTLPASVEGLAENGQGFAITPQVDLQPVGGNGGMGLTVDGLGDVNGDGFPDILVTASNPFLVPGEMGGVPRVWVVHGGGPTADVSLVDVAEASGGFAINSVSSAQGVDDFDGDGLADVLLGRGTVLFGTAEVGNADQQACTDACVDIYGLSIDADTLALGDFNGDGFADIGGITEVDGNSVVVFGRSGRDSIDAEADLFPNGVLVSWDIAAARPERMLALGDIDGDGRSEFAARIRVSSDPPPQAAAWGSALGWFVIRGQDAVGILMSDVLVDNLDSIGFLWRRDPQAEAGCYRGTGDLDGDGFDDLIFGAPGEGDTGRVDIVRAAALP